MNEEFLLASLRSTLAISSAAFNDSLISRIRVAQARIAEHGIVLQDTEEDRDLVVMYAAWLWRARVSGDGMPRMLQFAINNRLFSRKARTEV